MSNYTALRIRINELMCLFKIQLCRLIYETFMTCCVCSRKSILRFSNEAPCYIILVFKQTYYQWH